MISISKFKRPLSEAAAEAFIAGAPDAKGQGAPAIAPAVAPAVAQAPQPAAPTRVVASSTRKQPISLTIDPAILSRMDTAAAARGLSRAAAFADACADWLKNKEAA